MVAHYTDEFHKPFDKLLWMYQFSKRALLETQGVKHDLYQGQTQFSAPKVNPITFFLLEQSIKEDM